MIASYVSALSGQPVKIVHASAAQKARFERRYKSMAERLGGSLA